MHCRLVGPWAYDAAMKSARWRWILIPMVVLIIGCQPPPPVVPTSLLSRFSGKDGKPTFTVQTPPAGQTGQDVVDAIRGTLTPEHLFGHKAVPVFGVIDCHGDPGCSLGLDGDLERGSATVWLVLFPDCIDYALAPGDFGWMLVYDFKGVRGIQESHDFKDARTGFQESLPCVRDIYPVPQIPWHRCRVWAVDCSEHDTRDEVVELELVDGQIDHRDTARSVAPL